MVRASVHWFACFRGNSCGENPFGCIQCCSPPAGGDTVLFLDWLHLPSLHKVIYTCFKVQTVLTPQLTQLGQQTALHNSPNYPSAPDPVQQPRQVVLIYNGALRDRHQHEDTQMSTHTIKIPTMGNHAFLTCVSALLVTSRQRGLCLRWAGSPSKPATCCRIPILISHR